MRIGITSFTRIAGLTVLAMALTTALPAHAKRKTDGFVSNDAAFLALREAARDNDAEGARAIAAQLTGYEVPSYVAYYQLKPRITSASESEVRDFLTRFQGTAIADRLRNDWLLALGHRGQWALFDEHYPLFVVNDDLQLKCYALTSRILKGQNVAADARALLLSPKDYGTPCSDLLATLLQRKQFTEDDIWAQIRLAGDTAATPAAKRIGMILNVPEKALGQAIDMPTLAVAKGPGATRQAHEVYLVALGRFARTSHNLAALSLQRAEAKLNPAEEQIGWAQIALQASLSLAPEAGNYWQRAKNAPLSYEAQQWKVRMALRNGDWPAVRTGIEAMPAALRQDPAWTYWLARALKAEGKPDNVTGSLYRSISTQNNFYGQLALEELGQKITVPERPQPVSPAELAPMATNPGFKRALKFFAMGLRFEGMREWNWELRKLTEREHLAAAEFARQSNVLDRMVNTSDRTRNEIDFTQRFPYPHNEIMNPTTQTLGLDKAWVYGLIRQESRFIQHAQSGVGASGLMQIMPATARYVAQKIGLSTFDKSQVNDIGTNILLGTNYLKMVLANLEGSQTMATAAYNAGPGRPHAWRAKLPRAVEGAIFAETIPFSETRSYVKNVLSNATYYAAIFENKPQSLRERLGQVAPKGYTAPLDAPPPPPTPQSS
ncbi:MAG TPA: transglycosylase SLT domain-containing protein [Burkholderiaceae bacterium]